MEQTVVAKIAECNLSDKVTLVNQTGDMPNYYPKEDVYLLPSHYEGHGITAIEAQACGVKCLASSNVPKVADCGLMHFFSLEEGTAKWAAEIQRMLSPECYIEIDEDKLHGYSMQHTVKQIDEVYQI